jgi:hypothetical protein
MPNEATESVKAAPAKRRKTSGAEKASASAASGSAKDNHKLNEESLGNSPKVNAFVEKELQTEKINCNNKVVTITATVTMTATKTMAMTMTKRQPQKWHTISNRKHTQTCVPKDSGHGKAVVPSAYLLDTQAIQQQDRELQQTEEAAAMAASTTSGQGLHLGWLFIFALMFGLLFIVAYFVCLAFV